MTGIVIAFFLGINLAAVTVGPGGLIVLATLLFIALFLRRHRWAFAAISCLLGALWLISSTADYLDLRIDDAVDPVRLSGTVIDLPRMAGNERWRFRLVTDACQDCSDLPARRLLMTWVEGPELRSGDRVNLTARVRGPRGLLNPGTFDYETWAFTEDIHGSGYVLEGSLIRAEGISLDQVRGQLSERLQQLDARPGNLLPALAVGDRRQVGDPEWRILRATGTTHLLAISGLHIGLLAAFGALLGSGLFRLLHARMRIMPRRAMAAIGGLMLAVTYAAMAGFSLPTQRALIMFSVWVIACLLRRRAGLLHGWVVALGLVMLFDPRSMLSVGFWLSFAAVSALILVLSMRDRGTAWLQSQWVVFLALFPILMAFGIPMSPFAPLINLLAIPWLGIVVLPSMFCGLVVDSVFGNDLGLLTLASTSLRGMMAVLGWMSGWLPEFKPAGVSIVLSTVTALGVSLLLMPRGVPVRIAGALAMTAGIIGALVPKGTDDPEIHVLDVGQGLAILVRTADRALLYDTGPLSRSGWSAAESVIGPYLIAQGVHHLDTVVISHGDSDHAGGIKAIGEQFPVDRWLGSSPDFDGEPCRAGQRWSWGDTQFEMLHPTTGLPYLGNDSSCVLLVRNGQASFLLSGDIGEVIEGRLARTAQPIDGLTMPHHGSRTSSSGTFLDVFSPRLAIASAAHGNRFGMPHEDVVRRHDERGIDTASTAECGRIVLLMDRRFGLRWIDGARQSDRRRWRPVTHCSGRSQTFTQKTSMIRAFQAP